MKSRLSAAEWAWLPVVALALLFIYLPGLGNALVYDDTYLVEGLFSEYASALQWRVRLLSYGSFVWIQELFGEGWWKQRVFNLLLHAAAIMALWALYREILRHVEPAHDEGAQIAPTEEPREAIPLHRSPALGLAIGFFALNPVATYAVAYLIQRSILMATLFTVLALWLFARGLRLGKPLLHLGGLACYALAVLSKEHAVLAPLAALPVYIVVARPPGRRLALLAGGGAAVVAVAAALLYQRYAEIIGTPFDEYSVAYLEQLARLDPDVRRLAFPLSIVNEAWLFFRYGVDWMLPWSGWLAISIRPPFPLKIYSFPQVLGLLGFAAVVVGGFILLLRYRDWRALLGLSLLFPALLFGTEFVTVWVQDPFSLYRSYLWAIGIPGLVFLLAHGAPPKMLAVAGGVLALILSWQASDRVRSMATPERAWSDAIAKLPDDPRAVGRWFPYLNRGAAYMEQNAFNLALRDFEISASLGDRGMGMFNIGAILSTQGRHRDALTAFDRAREQGYNLPNLSFHRGMALLGSGNIEQGFHEMQAAAAANPAPMREAALLHAGRAGMQLGRHAEAAAALEQLVAADPRHGEARSLLGLAYVAKGEPAKALAVLDPLLREQPSGRAYYARALAHYGLKRKPEAMADIDNALRLGPDNPNLREWHAKIAAMP